MKDPVKVNPNISLIPALMVASFLYSGYIGVIIVSLLLLFAAPLLTKSSFENAAQIKEISYAMLCYSFYAILPGFLVVLWLRGQTESVMTESVMITSLYWLWSVMFMQAIICFWSSVAILFYKDFWQFPLVIRFKNFPHKTEHVEKLNLK